MALAANGTAVVSDKVQLAAQGINAAEFYNQALLFMGHADHATSTSRGRLGRWTSAISQIPMGLSTSRQTGNTSATPIVEATSDIDGRIMKNIAVTGLAGTVADNGVKVYATDDGTFTLTRPSAPTLPVGFVTRFISATNANVFFYSVEVLMAMAMAGERKTVHVAAIAPVIGTGYLVGDSTHGITWNQHGRFTSLYAICLRAPTDADVNLTINLKINDTAVTGGVVTLDHADAVGAVKAGATAISALNTVHEGDLVQVQSTQVAAPTATDVGEYNLYATFESDLGL
jgi:hypothetical protein